MSSSQPFTEVLRRWAEVFMRRSMSDFRDFSRLSGFSMAQMGALFQIYHRGVCSVSDLGGHLGVTNAAASQMIDRLVAQGLLQRSEDPMDRRAKSLALSQKGQELVHAAIEARRRWMEALTDALSLEQQEAIAQALITLTQAACELEEKDIRREVSLDEKA